MSLMETRLHLCYYPVFIPEGILQTTILEQCYVIIDPLSVSLMEASPRHCWELVYISVGTLSLPVMELYLRHCWGPV